eukprot:gene12422-26128_t
MIQSFRTTNSSLGAVTPLHYPMDERTSLCVLAKALRVPSEFNWSCANDPSYSTTPCFEMTSRSLSWHGIRCSTNGQVTTLNLTRSNLTGTLPSAINSLIFLTHINLEYNAISGTIPKSYGIMPSLQVLNLRFNSLTGSVPSSFCTNSKIMSLYTNGNSDMKCYSSCLTTITSCNFGTAHQCYLISTIIYQDKYLAETDIFLIFLFFMLCAIAICTCFLWKKYSMFMRMEGSSLIGGHRIYIANNNYNSNSNGEEYGYGDTVTLDVDCEVSSVCSENKRVSRIRQDNVVDGIEGANIGSFSPTGTAPLSAVTSPYFDEITVNDPPTMVEVFDENDIID